MDLHGCTSSDTTLLNRVCTGLAAARATRPCIPTPTAGIDKILTDLRSLGSLSSLQLRQLRMKAIVLLALCAFCRPSDLACVPKPSLGNRSHEGSSSRFRISSITWTNDGIEVLWYGSKANKGMSANSVH